MNKHFKTKKVFMAELSKRTVKNEDVCYIADSKEIYTHGTFFCDSSEVVKFGGRFNSSSTPYAKNTMLSFAGDIVITSRETAEAPYGCWTDAAGNRFIFNDGGYAMCDTVLSKDWSLLVPSK